MSNIIIPDYPFTQSWLEVVLNKSCESQGKIKSQTSTRIGEDEGTVSRVFKITLEWTAKDSNLPRSIVMKIPSGEHFEGLTPEAKEEISWFEKAHARECAFYSVWDRSLSSRAIPKCHYGYSMSQNTEAIPSVLILEDMTDRGVCPSVIQGLDMKQLKAIVRELALLHAWSLSNQDLLSKITQQHLKKIGNSDNYNYIFTLYESMKLPPVICHGDLWHGNLMFAKSETNAECGDELIGIIDWQLSHPGVPGEDLSKLLLSADPALRRNSKDEILHTYYDLLQSNLKEMTGDTVIPFSFRDLAASYQASLKAHVSMMIADLAATIVRLRKEGSKWEKENFHKLSDRLEAIIDDHENDILS